MLNLFVFIILIIPITAAQNQLNKPASSASTARSYILLSNLQSGSNIGSICRNALAFGVSEVVVVGRKDFKVAATCHVSNIVITYIQYNLSTPHNFNHLYFKNKMRGSDRGAKFRQNFAQFPSTSEAVDYLRKLEPDGLQILGVEITKDSESVAEYQYKGPTAFVFGNEGEYITKLSVSTYNLLCVLNYLLSLRCISMLYQGEACL